ncbi:MAG: hypothetical protein ACC662_12350 [Planctomycetota bacterium]
MRSQSDVVSSGGSTGRGSGPGGLPALLLVLLGVVLGLLTGRGSLPALHGDGGHGGQALPPPAVPTPNVHVALHRDEPLAPDRTTVWTAAFQTAWDRLCDLRGFPQGIRLLPPARPEAVEALNAGRLPPDIVGPGDLTVVAGRDEEATWARIDRASDRRRPVFPRDPDFPGYVVFARLRASLRYATPFFVHDRPLRFGSRRTPVGAWGLRPRAQGAASIRMRA